MACGRSIDGVKTVIISKVPENYDYLAICRSHKINSNVSLISDIKKPMLNIYKNNRIAYASI
jgi:hypothetical protein